MRTVFTALTVNVMAVNATLLFTNSTAISGPMEYTNIFTNSFLTQLTEVMAIPTEDLDKAVTAFAFVVISLLYSF